MTAENTPDPDAPDTIVLIHGFWVTPRSWEKWVERYESRGYRVFAPAYPGLEVEVEALNEDPSPIEALTVPAIVEHYKGIIEELDSPPILMGHSFGGVLVQILLDHGYGAAGVVIDSVPAEGIKVVPVSQIRATFPVLKNPANRHKAVGFTKEQFHYAFTNTLSEEESREVYERYHIPAPGNLVWGGVLANFTPGHQDTYVNFRNEDRAPLLFIAGARTTSCLPLSTSPTSSTTATPRRSQTTRSLRDAPTTRWARRAGRRLQTTPLSGPKNTPTARRPERSVRAIHPTS
jgi:pimeloyl-ACP methyl ester carboxylesterase